MKKKNQYSFCIVTYETFPNPITQNLKTFLLQNYDCNILYIAHPMLDLGEGFKMSSKYDLLKKGGNKYGNAYHWRIYWPFLYIKDIIYTLYWIIKLNMKFDIYFACGNLNPIAGLILRKFKIVKKVVYQSIDYYPSRYENKLLDWVYFQLDKFCVKYCDETWNVTDNIAKAREEKMGMKREVYNKQYVVPGGVWFHKTKRLPFSKINTKKIVYRGMLFHYMGVDLAIKAMPSMLKKIPDLRFEIVGTGPESQRLKQEALDLGVEKQIIFHGFVKERKDVLEILSDGALGIATFNTKFSEKIKNSDPGKIKDYMLMGMPVITTNAVYSSAEIAERKCGLVVDYNTDDFAQAVIDLLKDKEKLRIYRENAIKYIERFDCANILKPNVERVLNENTI